MNDIQPCKRCGEHCNREHFAEEPCPNNRLVTYLYCESCNRGWESIWEVQGNGRSVFKFDIEHGPHNQREFDRFLLNLRMNNSVAA